MKCWTILALLVAVFAVFLGVGHTDETANDFKDVALEDNHIDTEDEKRLTDLLMNLEADDKDDETEHALAGVEAPTLDEEGKPEEFKRSPWRRRRRRRRRRRGRFRAWVRKVKDKFRNFGRKLRYHGQRACRFLQRLDSKIVRRICGFVNGDEEFLGVSNDENTRFISEEEAYELLKQPEWVLENDE